MINDLKQRAYEQERSENFGQAIELYESVIDHREAEGLTHQDASVFLRIADLHLRRDQEEDAIEAFQRAGELYAREGLQPQAIAVYRRILRIAPEHTEALWNLAWLHAEMGVMAEARDYVAEYLDTVDMERDWVEAKDFLRRLLDLSEDVAIGLRLAELLEEAGRHDQALETLERLDVDFRGSSSLDEDEIRSRIEDIREEVVPEEERIEDDVSFEDAPSPEPGGGEAAAGTEFEGPAAGPDETAADVGDEPSGFEEEPYTDDLAAADRDAGAAGEAEADGEYDLEIGAGEEGSLDEDFPFPDADEELENGAFDEEGFADEEPATADARDAGDEDGDEEYAAPENDWSEPEGAGEEDADGDEFGDFDDEVERPPAAFGDEVAAADDEDDGDEEFDDEPAGGAELAGDEREDDEPWSEPSARGAWDADESDEHRDEQEEDEEEQMSTQSEDLPGGTAVEEERQEDTFDGGAPGQDRDDAGFGGPATGAGVGGADEARDYEEEYGERAELRRGLDVLDELIELDPDRLDHYRRRVGYAERLEDDEELVESWLEMADTLRGRDSTRAARLVYEHVLGIDPGAERVQQGIEELDRRAREAVDAPELFADVDAPAGPEADRSELARRVWPEMESVRGQVRWLQAAAEMLRSDGDGEPPAEAYVMAGRYYLAKDDVDEAIDVMSLALDRPDLDDADLADVLFQLGLSHYRIDDHGSARKYFDRVAARDEDFGTVCDWVLS